MKKLTLFVLSFIFLLCATVGLVGCKEQHTHSFTEQKVEQQYLALEATCTEAAKYYYSCSCGEKGTETFEYGSTTNHNFVNGCCTYCGKKQETSRGLAFKLLDDGTYEVSGIGSCTDTEIVIPSVYNDEPVTSIGDYAFYNCSGLTSVTIPDSVTLIGDSAFSRCTSLTSITIPGSVTSIGDYTFYHCSGLTSVTIPDSVTSIGRSAFYGCSGLKNIYYTGDIATWCNIEGLDNLMSYSLESKKLYLNNELITDLVIPNSVTSIGRYAFSRCSGLTSVTIPDSVTSIGGGVFYDCSSLTSITIPDSVTSIGYEAFMYCYKLVKVINKSTLNIEKGSKANGYVGYYALNIKTSGETDIVNKNGYLFYTDNGTNYLLGYVGTDTDLVLPGNYNGNPYEIYKYAFYGCSGLTSVTIPSSVRSIGYYAFCDCSGLTSVTIPDSVTSIGSSAFSGCSGLEEIHFYGTKSQWKAISKGSSWNSNVPSSCKVICTDGEISL